MADMTPMAVKIKANPITIARGASLFFSVEYAMTPGMSGRLHGDAILTSPAKNAAANVTISNFSIPPMNRSGF